MANLDQGSDVTLIHRSYKNRIRHGLGSIKKPSISAVTSFSNHSIPVLSEWELDLRLSKDHPPLLFTVFVIPDIPGSPPFLIGEDFLLKTKANLVYMGEGDSVFPDITITFPIISKIEIFYEQPSELESCYTETDLDRMNKRHWNLKFTQEPL